MDTRISNTLYLLKNGGMTSQKAQQDIDAHIKSKLEENEKNWIYISVFVFMAGFIVGLAVCAMAHG